MTDQELELVCFTLIVDDIVFPDGRACMEVLGGGGPQSLFGYQLVTSSLHPGQAPARVGLAAGVGADLPPTCKAWLERIGCDVGGLAEVPGRATPRAWQVFEDGRRTQVWRGKGDPCDALYEMLRPSLDKMPKHFSCAINYHLGIHPLHPPKRLMAALRQAAHGQGGMLSIEPYTAAEEPATPTQVALVLSLCDVFSPNEAEAATLVGPGKPEELASRLLALSPPGGAHTVVVRCGPDGVVLRSRQESLDLEASTKSSGHTHQAVSASPPAAETRANGSAELGLGGSKSTNSAISGVSIQAEAGWHVPAVADTSVVDVTGCGNAFCGGFLAALYHLSRQPSLELQPSRISSVPAASGPSAQSSEQGGEHVADSDRSSILARAAVWGCVAASIMAEHQGVPQSSIASFQALAQQRYSALLPSAEALHALHVTDACDPCRATPVSGSEHAVGGRLPQHAAPAVQAGIGRAAGGSTAASVQPFGSDSRVGPTSGGGALHRHRQMHMHLPCVPTHALQHARLCLHGRVQRCSVAHLW